MAAMANLQIIAKGGLVVLIVVSVAILIERLTNTTTSSEIIDLGTDELEDKVTPSPVIDKYKELSKIEKCLSGHSKSPHFLKQVKSTCHLQPGQCMYLTLMNFSELMESFHIKLQLIEPSLLFCLLPSPRKYNLITRGFSNIKEQGLKDVITFSILPSEAEILDQTDVRWKLISAGYKIIRFTNRIKSGSNNNDTSETSFETVRFFIRQQDMVIHLITLYPKEMYLWFPYLNSTERSVKGLQYVNDSAFEKFTTSPLPLSTLSTAQIYLPSDPRCFLLDMMSSKFLECKENISYSLSPVDTNGLKALKELKVVLASQMVIFWLWSKSLQGWLEQCNVFHYSPKLNIALAAKSVEGFNFTALFANSECQHIENHSNLGTIVKIELNCHGLSVNVFLMYENKNALWYEHFDGHNTYKLSFPKYTLCSTDVFGMKINIPCETNDIFQSEYGQFLRNTTLQLNPDIMRNVILESNIRDSNRT